MLGLAEKVAYFSLKKYDSSSQFVISSRSVKQTRSLRGTLKLTFKNRDIANTQYVLAQCKAFEVLKKKKNHFTG